MMKQKTYIGLLIAMLWMSVGANAQNYQVNIESTSNGQISASPSTGLSKGTTVSLKATASIAIQIRIAPKQGPRFLSERN